MEGEGGKMLLSSGRTEVVRKTTKKVFGVSSGQKKAMTHGGGKKGSEEDRRRKEVKIKQNQLNLY